MRYDITYMMQRYNIHNNYELPRLVSFPRTGSHWFRYVMEVAVKMPAMVSSYYYPNPDKCWGIHIHDRWLDNTDVPPTYNLQNVIYLYRDPKDTIYSQLRYDKTIQESWNGERSESLDKEVNAIINQYTAHLLRWRFNNSDIKNYLEIRYEDMMKDPFSVFKNVFKFLSLECDDELLRRAIADATKDRIDSLITDRHAMDPLSAYNEQKHKEFKKSFFEKYGSLIEERFKGLI